MKRPYIAVDTKEPLVVMGGYRVDEDGGLLQQTIKPYDGGDFGTDPLPDKPGFVKMVPSGEIVTLEQACARLKENRGL